MRDHDALRDLVRARESAKKINCARASAHKFCWRHVVRPQVGVTPDVEYLEWGSACLHFAVKAQEAPLPGLPGTVGAHDRTDYATGRIDSNSVK